MARIKDTEIYDALERVEDRGALVRAWGVSESLYSRWKSPQINGEDNHRRGPFELIDAVENYIRAEFDKAVDAGDEEKKKRCIEALELMGNWGAQKGKGVFILRAKAQALMQDLFKASTDIQRALKISGPVIVFWIIHKILH